jgi:DHA2 family multidrug resistance protein
VAQAISTNSTVMMNTVRLQGLLMSFSDVFLILTVLFVLMACATPR